MIKQLFAKNDVYTTDHQNRHGKMNSKKRARQMIEAKWIGKNNDAKQTKKQRQE